MDAAAIPAVAFSVALALSAPPQSSSVEHFLEREALYVITAGERAAFLALESEGERLEFIDDFWWRRDPDPTTPRNEYRDELARRLEDADRIFAGEGIAGWKTDRGRSYVVYGPPDQMDVQDRASVETEVERQRFRPAAGRRSYCDPALLDPVIPLPLTHGRQIWYYHDPPPELTEHGGRLVFLLDPRGRWILQLGREPNAAAPFHRGPSATDLARPKEPAPAEADPALFDVERTALDDMVLNGVFRAAVPASVTSFTLPTASEHVFVPIVIGIDSRSLQFHGGRQGRRATVRVFGVVTEGAGESTRVVESFSTPIAVEETSRLVTLVVPVVLPPGEFRIYVGVLDSRSSRLGTVGRSLTVPDFEHEPRMSSIVLGASYRSKAPEESVSIESGELDLGGVALALEADFSFRREDSPEVFFHIAGVDGPFVLRYSLFRGDALAAPVLERRSNTPYISQPLPLSVLGLAVGSYRLEVRVIDEASGRILAGSAAFHVEP